MRNNQSERIKNRAELLFGLYYELGVNRSLKALYGYTSNLGIRISSNTLERYSARFNWQQKLIEMDVKLKESREQKQITRIEEMNERQAQDFRNAQALARAGMSLIARDFKETNKLDMSPQDIMTWLEKGAKGERLAMGEATERFEAMLYVYNAMIITIANIFAEVNVIRDERERDRQFRLKVDDLRHTKLIDYADRECGH